MSLGSWYTHLDTDIGYQDYYDFGVSITSVDAFDVGFEASYERQHDEDPICYESEYRSGTGHGVVFDDGFLEGVAISSGYLKSWCISDSGGEDISRNYNIGETYWVVGFLHPDLQTLELCSAVQGPWDYDKEAIREGGWQALTSGGCPNLAFPGHLTCTLIP
jgi:hypothetical protein